MPLPYSFSSVTELDTPQLDANFAALGALVVIPCACSGTNALTLTPATNTPTVSAYKNFAPVFAFIAANNSTAPVTANAALLGSVKVFKQNGSVQATSGDLVAGYLYYVGYNSALDSGNGGLVIVNPTFASTTSQYCAGCTSGTVGTSATVYLGPNGAQTTEAESQWVCIKNGTINLTYVAVVSAPGSAQSFTYTLRKNGADTAVTGTISGTGSFSFSSTTPITVNATDIVDIKLVTTSGATTTYHRYAIEIDP